MAEVRTVKIKDPKKAKRDSDGNLVLGEDGLPQYSTKPEDYRIITEADFEANQRDERVPKSEKYELFDTVRVKSGNDPVQEEERRKREDALNRQKEERAGLREGEKKGGDVPINSGALEAGERVEKADRKKLAANEDQASETSANKRPGVTPSGTEHVEKTGVGDDKGKPKK